MASAGVTRTTSFGIGDIQRRMIQFARAKDKAVAVVAVKLEELARESYRKQETPEGDKWAPAKDGHRPLLVKTGAMYRGTKGRVRGDTASVSGEDPKSEWHLKSYRRRGKLVRPARRWLPRTTRLPKKWRDAVDRVWAMMADRNLKNG